MLQYAASLMYTQCIVKVTELSDALRISFKSTSERTATVKESVCTCNREYPEPIYLHSESSLLFNIFCKGFPAGEVTSDFTISKGFDTDSWYNHLDTTGLDRLDFIHSIIDCLNKTSNIIDLRRFKCLLEEDGDLI